MSDTISPNNSPRKGTPSSQHPTDKKERIEHAIEWYEKGCSFDTVDHVPVDLQGAVENYLLIYTEVDGSEVPKDYRIAAEMLEIVQGQKFVSSTSMDVQEVVDRIPDYLEDHVEDLKSELASMKKETASQYLDDHIKIIRPGSPPIKGSEFVKQNLHHIKER